MPNSEGLGSWARRVEERLDRRLDELWQQHRFWLSMTAGLLLLLLLYFWPSILVTVHPGEQGVMFRRFGQGTVTDETYSEGLHFVPPWDTLYIYDVQIQRQPVVFQVLTSEGLEIEMQVSIRYHPNIRQLGLLHKRVGVNYFNKIVRPAIISELRTMVGSMTAEQIYSTDRVRLERTVRDTMNERTLSDTFHKTIGDSINQLDAAYLTLDELMIERLVLPASVQASIESKARAKQMMLEYDFRLEIESREAKRKQIEAEGIRDFQDTVSMGISEQLLRWRGIEATLQLARSENAKVVVIGGKEGLPLILDTTTEPRGLSRAGVPGPSNAALAPGAPPLPAARSAAPPESIPSAPPLPARRPEAP